MLETGVDEETEARLTLEELELTRTEELEIAVELARTEDEVIEELVRTEDAVPLLDRTVMEDDTVTVPLLELELEPEEPHFPKPS